MEGLEFLLGREAQDRGLTLAGFMGFRLRGEYFQCCFYFGTGGGSDPLLFLWSMLCGLAKSLGGSLADFVFWDLWFGGGVVVDGFGSFVGEGGSRPGSTLKI